MEDKRLLRQDIGPYKMFSIKVPGAPWDISSTFMFYYPTQKREG
jgi:hypothetical protein